jgi:hypothetical protein
MTASPLFTRLVVGIVGCEPTPREDLHALLRNEALTSLKNLPVDGSFARIAFPILRGSSDATDGYRAILDGGLMNGVRLGSLDAILELSVPAATDPKASLVDALAGFAERNADGIDRSESIVAVGTDFVILDGDADIQLFYFMRRNQALTLREFTETWRDEHTKVSRFTPGLSGYRQLHVDAELSASAAESSGIKRADVDGVALEWFTGVDAFINATSAPPEFLEQAKASESRFNDLSRVTAILTRVREILPRASP